MIRAKVVGAGGYGGVGMVELLLGHPEAEIVCLAASADTGMLMSALYPHLAGFCDMPILSYDDPAAQEPADVVFFATPDGVGMQHAAAELARGAKVIDYSGDFRFRDPADYAEYARRIGKDPVHKAPDLLAQTVYGLPELIAGTPGAEARLVGNPGCFAVSLLLGLAPAAAAGLIEPARIICDCKTAVSGAGKKPNPAYHYPARYDNMNAYKLAGHQHVCEVEKGLLRLSGKEHVLTFTPQVVPMCRGIMSCIYGDLADGIRAADVMEAYRAFYQDRRFVRLYDRTASVGTAQVRGTNFCNLIVDVDARNNLLRVISHIDNLMKGQAGNALQNMNILFGLPEDTGLNRPGQNP